MLINALEHNATNSQIVWDHEEGVHQLRKAPHFQEWCQLSEHVDIDAEYNNKEANIYHEHHWHLVFRNLVVRAIRELESLHEDHEDEAICHQRRQVA